MAIDKRQRDLGLKSAAAITAASVAGHEDLAASLRAATLSVMTKSNARDIFLGVAEGLETGLCQMILTAELLEVGKKTQMKPAISLVTGKLSATTTGLSIVDALLLAGLVMSDSQIEYIARRSVHSGCIALSERLYGALPASIHAHERASVAFGFGDADIAADLCRTLDAADAKAAFVKSMHSDSDKAIGGLYLLCAALGLRGTYGFVADLERSEMRRLGAMTARSAHEEARLTAMAHAITPQPIRDAIAERRAREHRRPSIE